MAYHIPAIAYYIGKLLSVTVSCMACLSLNVASILAVFFLDGVTDQGGDHAGGIYGPKEDARRGEAPPCAPPALGLIHTCTRQVFVATIIICF